MSEEGAEQTSNVLTPSKFQIQVHAWIEEQQTSHGVRHDDYNQYQAYCTRRLSRLRHHPFVKKELVHSTKYVSNTKGRPRHAYCVRKVDNATYDQEKKEESKNRQGDLLENEGEDEAGDDKPITAVSHENYLWVLLVSAERAWAHACALQRSAKRSRPHILRRLAKAKQFAKRLEACAKINADEMTYKECQAYTGWIKGSWALEKGEFKIASSEFAKAINLCHALAQTVSQDTSVENAGNHESLERKDLFATRAETVLRPLFRYCQYELKEAGEATFEEPTLFSESVTSPTASSKGSIVFRGQEIHIESKDLHVLMLKLQSLSDATGKSDNEAKFLQSLSTLDDALSLVQTSLQGLEKIKAGPAVNSKRRQLDVWKGYLQSEKIYLVMDHTQDMLKNISDHGQRIHVYDTLLKHAQSLLQLPRPIAEGEEEGVADEEDEFALQVQANILRIRALKCYHMGIYYYQDCEEYAAGLALLERAENLGKRALEEIAACDDDMPHSSEYLDELEELRSVKLKGWKICVESALFGDTYRDIIGAPPKNKPMVTRRPLMQRLDEWDAGDVLADVPPMFMPIPCKPVFYDLAWDYASDMSTPIEVVQCFIDKKSAAEEDSEQETKSNSGGLFSWLTG